MIRRLEPHPRLIVDGGDFCYSRLSMAYNKSSMEVNSICYFAETDARNRRAKFGIKTNDRSRHTYVIGKTGMGKSTLLENMAIQDMERGDGVAFIDPHGKTAELLLDYVPEWRIKDVLYFAPFDLEYPISFNVMEDVGPDKRHLVVSGLMSAFKKIWVDAWSARMEYILNNILLALLEYPGSTILGVNRMLADKEYRKKVVENVKDVSVRAFWVDEFAKYGDRYMQEAGAAIQNKVGQFISNPLIRNIIGQPKSSFDLRAMMDQRKIIIVNLSKGRVGEQNANLLGSMFVTKLYLAAMSRADLSDATLARSPTINLFVDEFQSFANESFANILSEARKYKLALTIAHQYIEQMSEEVRAAVFGNVGTMVVFRVGAYDAEVLEKEFAPVFTAEDIVNLGFAQIYLKLMIDGVTSPPFSAVTLPPMARPSVSYRDDIIEWTRRTYARVRADVEENIKEWSAGEKSLESLEAPRKKVPRPLPSSLRDHGSGREESRLEERNNHTVPSGKREEKRMGYRIEPPAFEPEPGFIPLVDLRRREGKMKEETTSPRLGGTTNPFPKKKEEAPVRKENHSPPRGDDSVHKSDLRSALASVLEKRGEEMKKEKTDKEMHARSVPPSPPSQQVPPRALEEKHTPASNEISPDDLEHVLHVPRNDVS